RNAVEHNAGTHDIERLVRESEQADGLERMHLVVSWNFGAKFPDQFGKIAQLFTSEFRVLVRDRQMSGNALHGKSLEGFDSSEQRDRFILQHAHAAHSRVDLEIDGDVT